MPYQKKTYELALDEVGCPELKVVVRDPSSVVAAERDKIQDALLIVQWARFNKQPLAPEDRWVATAVDDYTRRAIVSWNLPYDDDWVAAYGSEADRGQVVALTRAARVEQVAAQLAAVKRKKDPKAEAPGHLAMAEAVVPEAWDPFDPLPTEVYGYISSKVGEKLLTPPKSSE